jgi:hypothetical protein
MLKPSQLEALPGQTKQHQQPPTQADILCRLTKGNQLCNVQRCTTQTTSNNIKQTAATKCKNNS